MELEEQLAAAREAARLAEGAVATAIGDFDLDPSAKNEAALSEARSIAASSVEHEERAIRLLDAARTREATAERDRLTSERDSIVAELVELRRIEQEDLVLAEAEMWISIARHRIKRTAHRAAVSACESRLLENHKALGGNIEENFLAKVDAIQPRTYSSGAAAVHSAVTTMLKEGRFADDKENEAVAALLREINRGLVPR